MALTDKQELFCAEYIVDFNATQAAIRAGYSEKTAYNIGWENVRKREIQERIKQLIDDIKSSRIADATEIQEFLTSVMRREKNENIVVTVNKEESTYKPDEEGKMRKHTIKEEIPMIVPISAKISDANKAAETLAKMQGVFDNKMKVELAVPIFEGEDSIED